METEYLFLIIRGKHS